MSAVIGLAGLIAMAEVGVRIARFVDETHAESGDHAALDLPAWRIPSATTGWEVPRLGKFSHDLGRDVARWTTNSFGMRGPEPTIPKPTGVYRILILGDEVLLGPALPDQALLGAVLDERLKAISGGRVEVHTLVVPQSCPLTLAIEARQRGLGLEPDLVLLHTSAEDLRHDHALRDWVVTNRERIPLLCRHPALAMTGSTNASLGRIRAEFALIDAAFGAWSKRQTPGDDEDAEDESTRRAESTPRETLTPIRDLATWCGERRSSLVVCASPVSADETAIAAHRDFVTAARETLAATGVPVVDLLSQLTPTSFAEENQWTAEGHARQAEFLAAQIPRNLPGPWSAPGSVNPSQAVPAAVMSQPASGAIPAGYDAPAPGDVPVIQRALR